MRQPLRISATAVDQFLKIGHPVHSFTDEIFTLEMWIADLQAGWQPTKPKLFGTAFGKVITEPLKFQKEKEYKVPIFGGTDKDGKSIWLVYDFKDEQISNAVKLMAAYRPSMFWEQKTELKFGIDTVVCKCDGLSSFLIDNKTTGQFSLQSYEDSYQWRLYLLAWPQAAFFRYHVFVFGMEDKNGYRKFKERHDFDVFRYDQMQNDCAEIIGQMSETIHLNNLQSYFQPYVNK